MRKLWKAAGFARVFCIDLRVLFDRSHGYIAFAFSILLHVTLFFVKCELCVGLSGKRRRNRGCVLSCARQEGVKVDDMAEGR